MAKFSRFQKLVLINSLMLLFALLILLKALEAHSIDVMPQGKFIKKSQHISENPTVQMYFDANKPPVVNVTPGRPTVVQFPSEVRSCISATNLITVTYGDKVTNSSAQNKESSDSWYSAAILNADGNAVQSQKITSQDLLKIPATAITCQIRVSSPDSERTDSYTWQTIGVKIARPEETYFVVYLLNNGTGNQTGLPTEKDLVEMNAIPINTQETHKDKEKYQSVLDLYIFSEPKTVPEIQIGKNEEKRR